MALGTAGGAAAGAAAGGAAAELPPAPKAGTVLPNTDVEAAVLPNAPNPPLVPPPDAAGAWDPKAEDL